MTEQSPNDIFRASSFLQGHNAGYIEQLHARYAADPGAVDRSRRVLHRPPGPARRSEVLAGGGATMRRRRPESGDRPRRRLTRPS